VKRREYEEVPTEPDWTVESINEAGEIIAHLQ